MYEAINGLIAADRYAGKSTRIAVIGDAMEDVWIMGDLVGCQDACGCFKEHDRNETPGGAANAARSLCRWNAEVFLISPLRSGLRGGTGFGWQEVNRELCFDVFSAPIKYRWLAGDKIVFRSDKTDKMWDGVNVPELRQLTLKALRTMNFDAVLISDYDKGFLDEMTIREIIHFCRHAEIPVVADAKRSTDCYDGALLKCNEAYTEKWIANTSRYVVTRGGQGPKVAGYPIQTGLPAVPCVNHVGAGDCFASHLTLALAHGLSLKDAAAIAHSAGRVYVQHPLSRPPWPFEIAKDIDPAGGKVYQDFSLAALRRANPGKVVFANGVFRIPHAGHAWLLEWAKKQGDVLVMGINDDESAALNKPGQYVLPLAERIQMLSGLSCVDWIVPFRDLDPISTIAALKPDILVKGHEYEGTRVPGAGIASVLFAPPSPYPRHCSDIEMEIKQ
jgi:D-beta-D-heptose 7-phosphate kinase/D-beta-D-heptose 1-phosphate adenosyltransferase